MTSYVVGFCFNSLLTEVALIRKKRPAWQAGRLNGIGGHVEANETPHDAMGREFLEEAGMLVKGWHHFADLSGPGFLVHIFAATHDGPLSTQTDEEVVVFNIKNIPTGNVLPNLKWLIPLAVSVLKKEDRCIHFKITETTYQEATA